MNAPLRSERFPARAGDSIQRTRLKRSHSSLPTLFSFATPWLPPLAPLAPMSPEVNLQHARNAVMQRVAAERPNRGEPACLVATLAYALEEARDAFRPLAWINRPLLDLCDLPLNIQPVLTTHVFPPPEQLVFQSAETASAYLQTTHILYNIGRALLRGEATQAEGTLLHISRLGRATVCDFVLALVPAPSGEMPESLLALWPTATAPQAGFAVRATLRAHAPAPPQAAPSSPKAPASPPISPNALKSKFVCHKAGRIWHPYAPDKA